MTLCTLICLAREANVGQILKEYGRLYPDADNNEEYMHLTTHMCIEYTYTASFKEPFRCLNGVDCTNGFLGVDFGGVDGVEGLGLLTTLFWAKLLAYQYGGTYYSIFDFGTLWFCMTNEKLIINRNVRPLDVPPNLSSIFSTLEIEWRDTLVAG
jgi:hypothetical protein